MDTPIGSTWIVGSGHGSAFTEGDTITIVRDDGDGTPIAELFGGGSRQAIFGHALLPVPGTEENPETLQAFKARVYEVFTSAADRTGVSGVPELLATLGISAPPARRRVFLTLEVAVEADDREQARTLATALVAALPEVTVTDAWGGE